ncbi:XamI family restriction endonuclease [Actinomadura rupiterrae]|uniref:XamI family restriction endonuclease n=1 Tax=Actinomadura rupiterrae TaxID=559627 RepID=UPI0020A23B5A|nr:XamI family restriction endonuclease [Actinomadura rupiterrae]MCP2342983.1 hypothetical protein [Actinomadura rupiterrae]
MTASRPVWTDDQLAAARLVSIEAFRVERINEPLEMYVDRFKAARESVESLLRVSSNLRCLEDAAMTILSDARLAETARYLAAPPISKDDLETITGVSMAATRILGNPERAGVLIKPIISALDEQRFPWLNADRDAHPDEIEVAVVATAAMQAMRNVETLRRNGGKNRQEARVKRFLVEECGFEEVKTRKIDTIFKAPEPGTFCGECEVGSRKADISVRLWDGRLLPIECKVSNSGTNSYKRINNDAAAKAVSWIEEFGKANAVPAAVLSGVFALANLTYAQGNGLTLFWAHDLSPLKDFISASAC